jgi:hypothetical protein
VALIHSHSSQGPYTYIKLIAGRCPCRPRTHTSYPKSP